jgi:hypothetical protein
MAKGEPVKVADIEIERVQELGVIHVAKALWDKLGIGAAISPADGSWVRANKRAINAINISQRISRNDRGSPRPEHGRRRCATQRTSVAETE